jgi:hypothetical protein
MDPSERTYSDTLGCLLAFPDGLNALQAVLCDRAASLRRDLAKAAEAALHDPALRPRALELSGRRREAEHLNDLIQRLRRNQT